MIDNGSTDGGLEYARSIPELHTTTCAVKGYGGAIQAGVSYLKSEHLIRHDSVLIVFDADGSSPEDQLDHFYQTVKDQENTLMIGQRTSQEQGAMPPHAKFGNWLQTFLISVVTGYRYSDMGPMRAMQYRVYQQLGLQDKNWGWNVEMQIKAIFRRVKILEIDIFYKKRKYGKSKISGSLSGSIKAGIKILYCVFYYGVSEIFNKVAIHAKTKKHTS